MLRANRKRHARTGGQCKQRNGNSKKKAKNKILKIRNIVTVMKNPFDGLISTLGMAKERISGLEDVSMETYKTEKAKTGKTEKKMEQNIQES